MAEIACRAKTSGDCYHGRDEDEIYADGVSQRGDGTWNGETIVCDPCYLAIGPFLRSVDGRELVDQAISDYHGNVRVIREHPDPQQLVDQVQRSLEAQNPEPGSPYHQSGMALLEMAREELEARQLATAQAAARAGDPSTSHIAAAKLGDLRGSQTAVMIVMRMVTTPEHPLLDEEIIKEYRRHTKALKLPEQSDQSIRSRRSELAKMTPPRLLQGPKRRMSTGGQGFTWYVAPTK